MRRWIEGGHDPIQMLREKSQSLGTPTLRSFAISYIEQNKSSWRGSTTETSWRRNFRLHAASIAETPIDLINTEMILEVLQPIWMSKAGTARKLRTRLEQVLDAAKIAGHRSGENPARWRAHLAHLLPKQPQLQKGHHPALPYEQIPDFLVRLKSSHGVAARALEFTALTCSRESMVLEARYGEIDRNKKLWTIPARRMKSNTEFRVPLSDQALSIIDKVQLSNFSHDDLIFPTPRAIKAGKPTSETKGGVPMCHNAMDNVMRTYAPGYVPHGLRSTFRDWAGDETEYPRELCEEALSHVVGNRRLSQMPSIAQAMPQREPDKVNVWVVAKDQQPTFGKNDVLAVIGDDILTGGSTKRLIKQVVMGAV